MPEVRDAGTPPAEICANADAVPVRLSTSVATGVGSVPIVLEAQSYSAGVDPNALTPPAPV